MNRRVLSQADLDHLAPPRVAADKAPGDPVVPAPAPAPQKPDNYETRVLKLIPADVVAVFVAVDGAVRASTGAVPPLAYATLVAVIAVATYFYVLRQSEQAGLPPAHSQALLSAISFLVWVFAIGGPFAYGRGEPFLIPWLQFYGPIWGTIVLPVYTLIAPMLLKK